MPSSYPGALDSFATNKANATATLDDHAGHHNDLADAINKIEIELGVDPAGAQATVAARLALLAPLASPTFTGDVLTDRLFAGRAAGAGLLGAFQVDDGDGFVALRVDQNDVTNARDAVKVVTASLGYGLKVDRSAGAHDTVNINAQVTGAHTPLGVVGSNTTLSTAKITNDAVQTAGAVIAGLGTSASRTAPIFRAENSGSESSYEAVALNDAAIGFKSKRFSATQTGNHFHATDESGSLLWLVAPDGRMGVAKNSVSAGVALDVTGAGRFSTTLIAVNGFVNSSTANNARLQTNTTGSLIDRNIADANPALTVTQVHASSTGDIVQFKNSAGTKVAIAQDGNLIAPVIANTQTGNYTLVLADQGKAIEMNVASGNTLTVPPNSSVAFPVGTAIEVYQMGAGQTTITPGSGVTLREREGKLKTAGQHATVSLRKRATDEWVVAGDVAA